MCLQSRWILILVLQICLGLGAVFWNADLWRCHHSSMSWVSALAPQPHSSIHVAAMTCIIPHWLIRAASKLPGFVSLSQLFQTKKKEKLWEFMLPSANHVDMESVFISSVIHFGQPCDGHADNFLFLWGLFLSCDNTVSQYFPFDRSVFYSQSTLPFIRLELKQMTDLWEMTSESPPHAPVRMPKYLQALGTHESLPLSLRFVQPWNFLNSGLWCCDCVCSTSRLCRSYVMSLFGAALFNYGH